MSHRLTIEMDPAEGALLRVLGTVERRGFSVLELNAGLTRADRQSLSLHLGGERDPEVLCRQLERLVDVRQVRLESAALPRIAPKSAAEPELAVAGFHASWLD